MPPYKLERPKRAELKLLKEITEYLQNIKNFPKKDPKKGHGRRHHIGHKNIITEEFILGKVRDFRFSHLVNGKWNRKHKKLLQLLKKVMRIHNPKFKWNQAQINKSINTVWHYNKANVYDSYAIGLGDFTGGGIDLNINGKIITIDNRNKWLRFNGSKVEHRTNTNYKGTRFAIILYRHAGGKKKKAAPKRKRTVKKRGLFF